MHPQKIFLNKVSYSWNCETFMVTGVRTVNCLLIYHMGGWLIVSSY